ncbi:hypothetical protein BKP35_10315 [Anaerobacillus arseniciselenatis]|uniref:DUF4367 domain-containing protein n=1 Tax=Anaerobacillus arseniciselenatis TaxID=85682 RepID=A0A1S2LK83_9BACI|nr:hypothetical protein [Anaerobacillus arseniciselenatis]OIJ12949.1 hypothetical protein BKP35_10315 [Anaerobacillus arseniciselenatis]
MSKNIQVVAVIVVLVGILIVGLALSPASSTNDDLIESGGYIIKENIAGFQLTEKITGEEALAQINHLHGQSIDIDAGYILHYETDNEMAIIWISKSTVQEDAERLFHEMNDIMGGSQMYSNHTEVDVNGEKIQYVFGMNMDNYYYFVEDRVIWIALTAGGGEQFLEEAIDTF